MPAPEVTHTFAPLRAFPAQPQLILDSEDRQEEKGVGWGCCGRDQVGKESWPMLPRKPWEAAVHAVHWAAGPPRGRRGTRAWRTALRSGQGLLILEREGERERGRESERVRERERETLICCFTYSLVDSYRYPDWGLNLQPWRTGTVL